MKIYYCIGLVLVLFIGCNVNNGEYVCTPCDLQCDDLFFKSPGVCPHCQMDLIHASDLIPAEPLRLNQINIQDGSGRFLIDGGGNNEKRIIIHYYKPAQLTIDAPVLMVVPGAGRNGNDYRDAWIENAEKYNILVLSPEYNEDDYPEFWSYNLAGMITDVEINPERTAMTSFSINHNSDEWIFGDFDRIFDLAKAALDLTTDTYDMFGHSAGGQLLHRLAIFHSANKARKILAANSGWYTVPDDTVPFPTGLMNMERSEADIDYSSELVIFLGALDNADETRGDLRHTPEIDRQGLHRLARGQYFFDVSKQSAAKLNKTFNWTMEVIPNVGHDHRGMSREAAEYLYGGESLE